MTKLSNEIALSALLHAGLEAVPTQDLRVLSSDLVDTAGGIGLVTVTGTGKSRLIAMKLAETLQSLSLKVVFVDPYGARHGGMGLVTAGQHLIAVSASGQTESVRGLLEAASEQGVKTTMISCREVAEVKFIDKVIKLPQRGPLTKAASATIPTSDHIVLTLAIELITSNVADMLGADGALRFNNNHPA